MKTGSSASGQRGQQMLKEQPQVVAWRDKLPAATTTGVCWIQRLTPQGEVYYRLKLQP